jgi:acyl carrier protein
MWDDGYETILRRTLRFLKPGQPLAPDAPMSELGLDSLEMVGLMATLEDHYSFVFPDEELTTETFRTPGALWSTVDRLRTG